MSTSSVQRLVDVDLIGSVPPPAGREATTERQRATNAAADPKTADPVVRISRDERNRLVTALRYWLDEMTIGDERAAAVILRAQVAECIRLRDEIGWRDKSAEDDRQGFDITMGPCLRARISDLLEDLTKAIQDEREHFAQMRGEPENDKYWPGGCSTLEAAEAKCMAYLAGLDAEHEVCATILQRLAESPVAPVVLSMEDLRAAAREREARAAGQMGVDWCTCCGALAEDAGLIDTSSGLCPACRKKSHAFDAGARHAMAAMLGHALDAASQWFRSDEIPALIDYWQRHGSLVDGHPFSRDDWCLPAEQRDMDRKLEAYEVVAQLAEGVAA